MFRLLSIILSLNLALAPLAANAKTTSPSSISMISQSYGNKNLTNKMLLSLQNFKFENISRLPKSTAKGSVRFVGHQLQTMFLIMVIAGAETVKQQMILKGLQKEDLSVEEAFSLAGPVSSQIVQSGDILMGMTGATAGNIFGYYPIKIITNIIENSETRLVFKKLLQTGIASMVTFIAWEFGAQLWEESLNFLNEDEFKRAKKFGTLFLNKIGTQSTVESQKNAELFSKIVVIMKGILADEDLRGALLYNFWRLRFLSGDFMILITSMVGASTLGAVLFPEAGIAIGMMFGLLGGGIYIITPKPVKKSISNALRIVRSRVKEQGPLYTQLPELKRLLRRYDQSTMTLPASALNSFTDLLSKRSENRSSALTAHYEQFYSAMEEIQILKNQSEIAFTHSNFSGQKPLLVKEKKYKKKLIHSHNNISNFYQREIQRLEGLLPFSKDEWSQNLVNNEISQVKNLMGINLEVLGALSNTYTRQYGNAFILLNKFYHIGYSENLLLKAESQSL